MVVDFFSQFIRITCALYCLSVGVSFVTRVLKRGSALRVIRDDLPHLVTEPLTTALSIWLNLIAELPRLLLDIVKWLGRTIVLGVCALINVILPLVDLPIDQVKMALPVLFT